MVKQCKYCGTTENLFSYKRKKDSMVSVCRVCKKCYHNILSKKVHEQFKDGMPQETREKLRQLNLGKKQSQETIEKRRPKLRIPCSEEKKKKISIAVTGCKRTEETKEKIRQKHIGMKQSKECIAKRVAKNTGKKHPPRTEEFRERTRIKVNTFYANRTPEYIENYCIERRKQMDNPITRQKLRMANIRRLQNGGIKISHSKPELKVKKLLEDLHINFIHQYYVKDIKHDYVADFCIPENKLIIEADGDFWHHYPTGREIDTIRTLELTFNGYKVLRFWERDIHNNIGFIKNIILETIKI